ncbi:hypothetical protein [Candidatus Tisiphia endosymbiont of Nemotelus uliginosus]|uniref:hypothetical protein n=1 Tax=Candidatus Tisiphia endosymbiont of Nemotelus uliginosus TaxID=3077926 RepID=UPI0035C9174E
MSKEETDNEMTKEIFQGFIRLYQAKGKPALAKILTEHGYSQEITLQVIKNAGESLENEPTTHQSDSLALPHQPNEDLHNKQLEVEPIGALTHNENS